MREAQRSERGMAVQRIGEVVESASNCFTAQCYRLYQSPPFGAFVRTESTSTEGTGPGGESETSRIYSVVYSVRTQSLDPGRPVIARGEDEDSEEDIYRSNPQLERLLCTRFEALIMGYGDGANYTQCLPTLPPRIHAFVYTCTSEEVEQFTGILDFLELLLHSSQVDRGITGEVIAACLRQVSLQRGDSHGFLVEAGKTLALHLAGDLPRLNSILKRLSP